MAITRKRLEELINENKSFYWNGLELEDLYITKIVSFNLKDDGLELVVHNCRPYLPFKKGMYFIKYKDLYENEKDSLFDLIYKNVARVENLNLPSYEEYLEPFCFDNYALEKTDDQIIVGENPDRVDYDNGFVYDNILFKDTNTKENYIKACDICVKLFKDKEQNNEE
jgi:hypothetical protein